MNLECTKYTAPTKEEISCFNAVFPIVRRAFPNAQAYIRAENTVEFNCTYTINQKRYAPDENTLYRLCYELNELARRQKSKINFSVWCEDISGPVPMWIEAHWD